MYQVRGTHALHKLSLILIKIFVFCLLIAPRLYWMQGVFTWFPLWTFEMNGEAIVIGLLATLPALVGLCWLPTLWIKIHNRTWVWGNPAMTLPLLGITLLIWGDVFTSSMSIQATLRWAENLILLWFVYLFVLNERPNLSLPLAVVCLIQGSIAFGQFLNQRELGLSFLGEKILDPEVSGIIIGFTNGQRWLRGYGLSGHPNIVGTILALCLLFLLPQLAVQSNWRKIGLAVVFGVGLLGLFATFSRGALLGFVGGVIVWGWCVVRDIRNLDGPTFKQAIRNWLPLWVIYGVIGLGFMLTNKSLIASRLLNIEGNPIELQSIETRLVSATTAFEVITRYPLSGVGLDNFRKIALEIFPGVETVHSIPLLITAELGILGGLFWLWLAISPFMMARYLITPSVKTNSMQKMQITGGLAAWVAVQIITQFHLQFWLGHHLYVPAMMALLCANVMHSVCSNPDDPFAVPTRTKLLKHPPPEV